MSHLESNIFPITNLGELRSKYRLYKIRGLSPEQDEYDHNVQIIAQKLGYGFKKSVTVILKEGEPHLVLEDSAPEPTSPFDLVGTTAYFEKTGDVMILDYQERTPETEPICQKFLQFAIQGALYRRKELWQPASGKPFFSKTPVESGEGVDVYRGFSVRVVTLEGNRIGVCVDVKHKYVSHTPLTANISKQDFRKLKNVNCIYHYGNQWYEIKLHEHSGLNIKDRIIEKDGQKITLKDYIRKYCEKPLPKEVIELPDSCDALLYKTGAGATNSAAAMLCYPVFDTEDSRVGRLHGATILRPHVRRNLIHDFVRESLNNVDFGDMKIHVEGDPVPVPKRQFMPPDLLFGNSHLISVRGTKDATQISLDQLGSARLSALLDKDIGPYNTKPLRQQYIIWPQSVADSYGEAFLTDLNKTVAELFPSEIPYNPAPIAYDDQGPKTYATQARAIRNAITNAHMDPGYGVVMIHETIDRQKRHEDQLAGMAMRESRDRDIYVSVIHSKVGSRSYELTTGTNGNEYRIVRDRRKRGKLRNYLRNVAINKILLTNERWPYVLGTPLHADLTIGIDVKLNTACFTLVGKDGSDIRTECRKSNQKERLGKAQIRTILLEMLKSEVELGRTSINSIVVHRDGRLYKPEIDGVSEAIKTLQEDGLLGSVSLNFVEIPKTSPAPLRLFDVSLKPDGGKYTENPQVGSYWIMSERDAFLCSTGRAFPRPGTANPLHIRLVKGDMPLTNILEDLYYLTCLAWTRPEDCTRYPVTIKLTDIRLREHTEIHDTDAIEYEESEEEVDDE